MKQFKFCFHPIAQCTIDSFVFEGVESIGHKTLFAENCIQLYELMVAFIDNNDHRTDTLRFPHIAYALLFKKDPCTLMFKKSKDSFFVFIEDEDNKIQEIEQFSRLELKESKFFLTVKKVVNLNRIIQNEIDKFYDSIKED